MAYKEVSRVDIVEVIRRWQKGNSQRHIASGTGLSRDTVRKYLAEAEEVGVSRVSMAEACWATGVSMSSKSVLTNWPA